MPPPSDVQLPPPSLSASTHPCPHLPRIFIGPVPTSASTSSSKPTLVSLHPRARTTSVAGPSDHVVADDNDAEEGITADDHHKQHAKRVRNKRNRHHSTGLGEWGEADNSGRGLKNLFRKRDRRWSVTTGDSSISPRDRAGKGRSGSVGTTATNLTGGMMVDDEGLGWFKIKWEGGVGSARSRSNSDALGQGGSSITPVRRRRSSSVPRILLDSSANYTSSPAPTIHTTNDTKSIQQSTFYDATPSPYLLPTSSVIPASTPRSGPAGSARPSLVSTTTGMESFRTARSYFDAASSLAAENPLVAFPDAVTPRSRSATTSAVVPLPIFQHTPASPTNSKHTAELPLESDTLVSPLSVSVANPPLALAKPFLRSSLRAARSEPHLPTATATSTTATTNLIHPRVNVHFPVVTGQSNGKGKSRAPFTVDEEVEEEEEGRGDLEPVPPEEVLKRQGGPGTDVIFGVKGIKAEDDEDDDEDLGPNSVLLRDRILVKRQYSRSSDFPKEYNDWSQRKIPADRSDAWEEKLVVLRQGRVEIWEEWNISLQERMKGKKKLKHVIYLKGNTSLSLYSKTDTTFCLTSSSSSIRSDPNPSFLRSRRHRRQSGTHIFIFNPKTRSRSVDWLWQISLQLKSISDILPRYINITIPDLDNALIKLDIPQIGQPGIDSSDDVLEVFSRRSILTLCEEALEEIPGFQEWREGRGSFEGYGGQTRLGLAWRKGDRLDWVALDWDVRGKIRPWNLLVGAGPLRQTKYPAKLELRIARHFPSSVHTREHERVQEPPGIEGYLKRIKPKTQARETVYLTSHDSNLFLCRPSRAHPPSRPSTSSLSNPLPSSPSTATAAVTTAPTTSGFFTRSRGISNASSTAAAGVASFPSPKPIYAPSTPRTPISNAFEKQLSSPATATVANPNGRGRDDEHGHPTQTSQSKEAFQILERERAVLQILDCNGFVGLRDIVDVRRSVDIHVRHGSNEDGQKRPEVAERWMKSGKSWERRKRSGSTDQASSRTSGDDRSVELSTDGVEEYVDGNGDEGDVSREDDDADDQGGEEGLAAASDRKALLEQRGFEIEFFNGEIVQFEAHSKIVAREWVQRINALRDYWRIRDAKGAKHEMSIAQTSTINPTAIIAGLLQSTDHAEAPKELVDPDDPSPYLEDYWNWCIIDDCRPITKAGRLFSRRGHRQYRSKFNVLCNGYLVQFSLHLNKPFHIRSHRFSLMDAYVYTGHLAQEELPRSSNEDAWKGEPRRYADGLQTADGSEDTCLVIWYRPHPSYSPTSTTTSRSRLLHAPRASDTTFIPSPLGKHGHEKIMLRARSKLDRDAWAWALNWEIERLVRRRKAREERMRNTGGVE